MWLAVESDSGGENAGMLFFWFGAGMEWPRFQFLRMFLERFLAGNGIPKGAADYMVRGVIGSKLWLVARIFPRILVYDFPRYKMVYPGVMSARVGWNRM